MIPNKLKLGDTIGIVSPSHLATVEKYSEIIAGLQAKGFQVKVGKNLYCSTYGYLASETERAEDINQMVTDDTVKMVFFGGGNGSNDVLPYIDYENICKHPKLFVSYSDGTSILEAIYTKTGLVTYYGQTPDLFRNLQPYDWEQFQTHFIRDDAKVWVNNSKWHSLHAGICEGILVGGYTLNFALAINSAYLKLDKQYKYILFLEDHEKFSNVAAVSAYLSHIEQSEYMNNICGLLFGHYSDTLNTDLLHRLERFGKKYQIPVAYCDDFGHGINHAIIPIGVPAVLDTVSNTLRFGL